MRWQCHNLAGLRCRHPNKSPSAVTNRTVKHAEFPGQSLHMCMGACFSKSWKLLLKKEKEQKTQWPLGILQLPCHRQSPPDSATVSGTPVLHKDSRDRDYEEWQASSAQPPTPCLTTHLPSLGISTSLEAEARMPGYCVKPSMQLAPVAECDIKTGRLVGFCQSGCSCVSIQGIQETPKSRR